MPRIYIFGSGYRARLILGWLAKDAGISTDEVSAVIDHAEFLGESEPELSGVPVVALEKIRKELASDDIIIVASQALDETVGELLSVGIVNVFDGDSMIRRGSAAHRFLSIASDLYLGPNTPAAFDPDRDDFLRYSSDPIEAHKVPRHKLFVVNSMPKSGTVWMMAMLEAVLGVKAKQQITLSHVADIEVDWQKPNNHGAMTLVRDMRDVVISWFHHSSRSDQQSGFSAPRYPSVGEFYFEYFIGQMFGSPRYYSGDLERWLDFAGAHSFPIVRYEDLVVDAQAALRKVMNFWKISVSDQALGKVARDYSFDNIRETVCGRTGYIAEMLQSGHMRHGQTGCWRHELPAEVAEDINQRFSGYQRRLRYV